MNKVVYIIIVIVLFSCKSKSVAQENKEIPMAKNKKEVERIQFGDPRDNEITQLPSPIQNRIEPGTVHVQGTIMSFYDNKTICDKAYKTAFRIKINQIVKSGSGIVNALSKDQETIVGFVDSNYAKKYLSTLKNAINKGKKIPVILKEALCPNLGTETVYEVVRFNMKI